MFKVIFKLHRGRKIYRGDRLNRNKCKERNKFERNLFFQLAYFPFDFVWQWTGT